MLYFFYELLNFLEGIFLNEATSIPNTMAHSFTGYYATTKKQLLEIL